MIFSFQETPASGAETIEPPTITNIYRASGEVSQSVVMGYAYSATPLTAYGSVGVLYRKDVRVDPDGWGQFLVSVPYGKLDRGSKPPVGSSTFSFDSQGATINIKAAKQHVATYGVSGVVAGDHHKGSINVKEDGDVEGVDIVIPALKLTYTFNHPAGIVSESFARTIASVTGMTNNAAFRGFQAGELLFLGASGSDGTDSDASVTYSFAASSNVTDLSIGEITGIAKLGHQYVWISFKDEVSGGVAVKQPELAHVEAIYSDFNFASVFGWS